MRERAQWVIDAVGVDAQRPKSGPAAEQADQQGSGAIDPMNVLTKQESLCDAISAYEAFDRRQPGWLKVALVPA